MPCSWERVPFGPGGPRVAPLGLATAGGASAADVEYAFERGINYLYWGTARRGAFGVGIRNVCRTRRADAFVVVQSYTRSAALMGPSLERALRQLGLEYADALLLGWWNAPPPRRIVDAALALRDRGRARRVMISCHNRPAFGAFIREPAYDAIMVRYNSAHPGAEREVFPLLAERRPAVVAYTATRWGALLDANLTPRGEATPRASDCYRFALSNPNVDVCLTAPADRAQLDEALAALDRGPLSDDEQAWMRRVGAHVRAVSPADTGLHPVRLLDRAFGYFSRGPTSMT